MFDHHWRKSSYTNGETNCVELSHTLTHVRDSKNRTGPTLHGNLTALIAAVKANQLNR